MIQKKAEAATNAMKILSSDLIELDLIDDVINEPLIGAHRDRDTSAAALAEYFLDSLKSLREMSEDERMDARYKKLTSAGSFSE